MNKVGESEHTGVSSGMRSHNKKSRGFQHPLSIPNDTAWGSDEAIVTIDKDGGVTKTKSKSSEPSLDTLHEESSNPFASNRDSKAERKVSHDPGLGEIVMTREWDISETREQTHADFEEAHMGYTEPAGWRR